VVIPRYLLDEDSCRQIGGNGDARRFDAHDQASLVADHADHRAFADAEFAKTAGSAVAEGEEADLDGRPQQRCTERDRCPPGVASRACHSGGTSEKGIVRDGQREG
jgi:hypothetical protein